MGEHLLQAAHQRVRWRRPRCRPRRWLDHRMDGHERLARPDLGEWTGGRAMSIPDHARTNFNTLLRTASDGNLALMECADAVTGETRYVICTVGRDGGDFVMTPFGHLADGNPYAAYVRSEEHTSELQSLMRIPYAVFCLKTK